MKLEAYENDGENVCASKKKFHAGGCKISKAALCGSHFLDLYVHVFPYLHVIFSHSISLAL